MKKVSFLGYGRFGAALGGLLREAGIDVRGLDPRADVPDAARASSLEDLVAGAEVVVVAVPVPAMHGAFESIRPHLAPGQIVIDVGSVKTGPARAMAAVFGDSTPWVATHPLFGPTSLARGERPLRAVVCPNPRHPDAVRRVTALFEQIGCLVLEQDPDTHDRAMAFTHALAFFVAKGMLDAGVPTDVPYAPPSFQAIVRTIEVVRSDAGHLFMALHHENPYAAGARRQLIEALTAVDRDVARLDDAVPGAASPISMANLRPPSPELSEARELIDELDQEIVGLLARRAQLARRAALAKAEIGHAVHDPVREAELIESRRRWAADLGLHPGSVDAIFQAILRFSRRIQEPESTP